VSLWGTTTEASGNRLVSLTDVLGSDLVAGGVFGTYSTLATAPANTVFRGVDFAPTAVPEPGSIMLCSLVAAAATARLTRRRRGGSPENGPPG
jgi:hypothetical protein